MGRHLLAALLAGGALAVSSAAFAHHSFAMFDANQTTTLEGTRSHNFLAVVARLYAPAPDFA